MDENLENQLNDAMKDAQAGITKDAVKQVGEAVATFYNSLIECGMQRRIAIVLTSAFISGVLSEGKNSG